MLTEQQLAEIEARAAAATPGPWEWKEPIPPDLDEWETVHRFLADGLRGGTGKDVIYSDFTDGSDQYSGFVSIPPDDAAFIAASRADVPALLSDLRECRRLLGRLVACVDGEGDVFGLAEEVRAELGEDKP